MLDDDGLWGRVEFEGGHLALLVCVREEDPGVVHVFAPGHGAEKVRGMTLEESALVETDRTSQAIDDLADRAVATWPSWETVDTLVVVHNVVEMAGAAAGEA